MYINNLVAYEYFIFHTNVFYILQSNEEAGVARTAVEAVPSLNPSNNKLRIGAEAEPTLLP